MVAFRRAVAVEIWSVLPVFMALVSGAAEIESPFVDPLPGSIAPHDGAPELPAGFVIRTPALEKGAESTLDAGKNDWFTPIASGSRSTADVLLGSTWLGNSWF